MFCSVLRLLRSARDWIRSGTSTSPSFTSASASWTLSYTYEFGAGVSISTVENMTLIRTSFTSSEISSILMMIASRRVTAPPRFAGVGAPSAVLRPRKLQAAVDRFRHVYHVDCAFVAFLADALCGPTARCGQVSDSHLPAMLRLGTATRSWIRPATSTLFAAHAARMPASWTVGGVARMRSPTSINSLPWCPNCRGFVSIVKKPEHPEDTTALEGNVLGVLLTERAIEVCDLCLT